ncbi:cobalamin synthesis protein P47K [Alicyclobacillus hesperidum URH17-3-68]|nr:cobalamin synthesis protein P47K [Alicyclobacillus hesperidum URH17-3-68]
MNTYAGIVNNRLASSITKLGHTPTPYHGLGCIIWTLNISAT